VFVYLTHAANPEEPPGVWRSHLISPGQRVPMARVAVISMTARLGLGRGGL
jgi:hypothetical protein